jgi:hypothetical protein
VLLSAAGSPSSTPPPRRRHARWPAARPAGRSSPGGAAGTRSPGRCRPLPTSRRPGPGPGPASTAGPPTRRQRPGIQRRVQRGQLLLIQPAPGRLPARGHPGQATGQPGLPPPPHRPLANPQLRGDHRGRRPLLESLHRFQPDQLPASSALGGQPAALRIPHAPCIPPQAARVSPPDITN